MSTYCIPFYYAVTCVSLRCDPVHCVSLRCDPFHCVSLCCDIVHAFPLAEVRKEIPRVTAQAVRWSGILVHACSSPSCCIKPCDLLAAFPPCNTWSSEGTAHKGGECDQSIGSTVSDAIVRSWLWLTVSGSSPLGYFSTLLQVVNN